MVLRWGGRGVASTAGLIRPVNAKSWSIYSLPATLFLPVIFMLKRKVHAHIHIYFEGIHVKGKTKKMDVLRVDVVIQLNYLPLPHPRVPLMELLAGCCIRYFPFNTVNMETT